ncbi:MAG: 2-hydroxychromene-2-carboxylate isomerase [Hydrogenophilales bacterium]
MKKLEFLFDFGSPTAYLAYTQMPKLSSLCEIDFIPVLLGAVFKANNHVSPVVVKNKYEWMKGDLKLWAEHYNVKYHMNDIFPQNTLMVMRISAYLKDNQPDLFLDFVDFIFNKMWVDNSDLEKLATDDGFKDFIDIEALKDSEDFKVSLKNYTGKYLEKGIFGVPTFFLNEKMFFGQDRINFVVEELKK